MKPEVPNALGTIPVVSADQLPVVTRDQMREVDRLMVDAFGIQLIQMMENAGLGLAELVKRYVGEPLAGRRVVVLAGRGNNGGGGLTAARRLAAWGADVEVVVAGAPEELRDVPALQLGILQRMGVPVQRYNAELPAHEVLIDAVIGYSLQGPPRGITLELIRAANGSSAPVISLDVPSGVDVDSGEAPGEAIRATATLTLALPKPGLLQLGTQANTQPYVGELYLADISVPPELYTRIGLAAPHIFAEGPLLRVLPT